MRVPTTRRQLLLHRPWFLPEGRLLTETTWARRHRGLTWVLGLQLPALLVFGLLRGFPVATVTTDLVPVALLMCVARSTAASRTVRTASTSLGLVAAASVLVHLSGGAIEGHFQYFVAIAFLTLYQAWLPFLLALVYVVLEHGILGALAPHAVYNTAEHIAHPWRWAAIHGWFVIAASAANVYSWRITERESLHDGLTELPNRTFALETLDRALSGRGRPVRAVMYLDLDDFKNANDAYGHTVGDRVLVEISERLRAALPSADLLARLGGDEFAVLHFGDDAEAVAQRLLDVLRPPIRVGPVDVVTGASIGLTATGGGASTAAELFRDADLAMYEAKRAGGDQLCWFRPALHSEAVREIALEGELRDALERGELRVHYQPIVGTAAGASTGCEALVRWEHPTRGLLGPQEFLPTAERTGLVKDLGTWVLQEAARATAEWNAAHAHRPPVWVSVNLAVAQIEDHALVDTVRDTLSRSGLAPWLLCLEITEGSVIENLKSRLPTLTALRELGVQIALDDFGTGYSSLSYLQRLPVTSLKVDRSFVSDLQSIGKDGQIVQAIVAMAHALGVSVTAEGAETEEQCRLLREIGCDRIQGYALGRPMPWPEFAALLDRSLLLPEPRSAPREARARA